MWYRITSDALVADRSDQFILMIASVRRSPIVTTPATAASIRGRPQRMEHGYSAPRLRRAIVEADCMIGVLTHAPIAVPNRDSDRFRGHANAALVGVGYGRARSAAQAGKRS
jgi:hypothetical protein